MIMIPILFYMQLKKIRKQNQAEMIFKISTYLFKIFIKVLISPVIFLLLSGTLINAWCQKLNYKVVRNGSDVGWMKLEKTSNGNLCKLTLHSEIKFRMIVLLTATVFDSACFANGKLIFSSQYHKINGNVKVNKQTRFTGNSFEVSEDSEKEKLAIPDISVNLLCLYFQEPVALKKVYCDKQECFADIKKTNDGGYKVRFPNGNSNCFYYSRGVCAKVKIDHTFYSAEIILNP